ncbi:MAG: TetR/AcrR family transcriptional regulator [Burkholderiales bacterium]|jgi:TetR/AcrR family transcriptional repressor of nem operon
MGRSREFDTDAALDGALHTFWQQGYESTPMQDLCSAMALNPGSIYAAFGSKRGLFVEALKRYAETVSAEAMRRINGASSGLDGIRSYFAHLIDAMVDGDRRFGCLITNSLVEFARNDPELAGMFDLHLARLETTFASALARARAGGEIRSDAGTEVARFLVTLVQGMNVLAKTKPDRRTLEGIVDTALAGLAPHA